MINVIAVCWLLAASHAGRQPVAAAAVGPQFDAPTMACLVCHAASKGVLSGQMATRAPERAFAERAFGAQGARFFSDSCGGCHVSGCRDCHGEAKHPVGKPGTDACVRCHRGYFTGSEYLGRAPREDHSRYQRGPEASGEHFLKMLPDVHHERGLRCADCHTVHALHQGKTVTRSCTECHPQISTDVSEHAITAHTEKMECYACHAAWTPQEYGTFLVRPRSDQQREAFSGLPAWGDWRKSAYLKRQDAPPLGLNARGMLSPIRPQFILFATDGRERWESRLLAAEWRATVPHTIRRGTTACAGCHDSPRRFLLEADADRLYLLEKDGLPLRSFWSRSGQTVTNGAFFPEDRYVAMNRRTPEFVRQYLRQWQNLLRHADPSSKR